MSISTYAELKTAVANWLHRTDLTDRIPEFILQAETMIAGSPDPKEPDVLPGVRCRAMAKRVTASISTEYIDIPSDSLEIIDIQINSTDTKPIKFLDPRMMTSKYPSSTTGTPKHWTFIGDEIQLKPTPGTSYTVEIAYMAKFAALSVDADYNWLLTNHPMIYLYGSLIAAAPYIKDHEETQIWAAQYKSLVKSLNEAEKRSMLGAMLNVVSYASTP